MNNKYEILYIVNPIIVGEMFSKNYEFRDFEKEELAITKHSTIVFVDKFGNGLMSSDIIDFDNIPEKIFLK